MKEQIGALLLTFTLALVVPCNFKLIFTHWNVKESVSDLVRLLLRTHFPQNKMLVILGSDDVDEDGLEDFTGKVFRTIHEESRYLTQTRGPRIDIPSSYVASGIQGTKAGGYVLMPQRNLSHSLTKYLMSTSPVRTWNPRAFWIVILRQRREAYYASRLLAKSAAVNVLLLVPRKRRRVNVYTWTPRVDREARCYKEVSKAPVFLDTWIGFEGHFKFNSSEKALAKFTLVNPKGCYVMTSVTHSPPYVLVSTRMPTIEGGIEIELYTTIARHLNFSVRYTVLWKTRSSPKLIDIHLVQGITDVAFSGRSYFQPLVSFIDSTVPYLVDRYVMHVPGGLPNPPWLRLVTEFRPFVWASVLVGCVIASLLLKRRFLVVWGLLLENPPPRLPVLKRFLVLYMLHCFVAQTSYKTSLVQHLINPGLQQPISSLKEVFKSDLKVCTDTVSTHLVIMKELREERQHKGIKIRSITSCLHETMVYRDTATAGSQNFVTYSRFHYIRNRKGKVFGSDPITAPQDDGGILVTESINMVTVVGHPLLERFNTYIGRLLQAGFVSKWWRDALHQLPGVEKNKTKTVLSLEHLKPVFLALWIGYTVSFLVFTYEWLSYNYKRSFVRWFLRIWRCKAIRLV